MDGIKLLAIQGLEQKCQSKKKKLKHAQYKNCRLLRGRVTLDCDGGMVIGVSSMGLEYKAVEYQLTPLHQSSPGLHIAVEYDRGQFAIAGGVGGSSVCWQLLLHD